MITVALHDGRATDLVIESCTTGVTGEVYTVLRPEIEMPRGDGIFLTWVEVGFRS